MQPGGRTEESVEATLQAVAVQRMAQAAVTGFTLCDEVGQPLTARQKIALLTAAMLELDGLEAELEGVLHVERLIAGLHGLDEQP